MTPWNCQYFCQTSLSEKHTVSFDVLVIVPGNTQVCVGSDVICHRPPTYSLRSKVVTSKPSSTKFFVAIKPKGPAPTIATLFRKPSEPRFIIVQLQKMAFNITCKKEVDQYDQEGFLYPDIQHYNILYIQRHFGMRISQFVRTGRTLSEKLLRIAL